jgi:alkylation response protein AidB-like acyl-CoA dehydrogenase
MYNLHLSPEQREIRDTVRDFVLQEIKPVALQPARLERCERHLPDELLDQASRIGLRTLQLGEESGGAGADNLTACIVLEELAAGDVGLACTLARTSSLARILFDHAMSKAQRQRFLPEFLDDSRYHLTLAVDRTEQDADLDWRYHRVLPEQSEGALNAARADNGDLLINGVVKCVPNAPLAKLFALQLRNGAQGSAPVALLMPRNTAGMTVHDSETAPEAGDEGVPRRPWYHGRCGDLVLENCRVPADQVLEARTFIDKQSQARSLPQLEAVNLGVGRAAFEAAIDYAKLRVQGGRTIVGHQAIGTKIADMAIKLEAARKMIWEAAWASDHPEACADRSLPDLPLQTMARVYTAEAVHEVTLEAAELFGAMGVMRDMPMQKYVHDSLIFLHSGSSGAVARFRIAEAVAGFDPRPQEHRAL